MKFKLRKGKSSVSGFTDSAGITHQPGDVVDLPESYKGEAWLETLEEEKAVVAAPGKIEGPAASPVQPATEVPLEPSAPKKSNKPKK